MKILYTLTGFIFLLTSFLSLEAQQTIAGGTTYGDGNTDLGTWSYDGDDFYYTVGQTFKSTLSTNISSIEMYIQNVFVGGSVDVEVYSCSNSTSFGSLLNTKTGVAISESGWLSIDVSSLNIPVVAGNFYGFKLKAIGSTHVTVADEQSGRPDSQAWIGYSPDSGGDFLEYDFSFRILGASALPINLMAFTAQTRDNNILLKWTTSAELQLKDFVIQRSSNGLQWQNIATIAAKGGGNVVAYYDYADNQPLDGVSYYRLLQNDLNGSGNFSDVKRLVNTILKKSFTVLGNPVLTNSLNIKVNKATTLSLFTNDGRLLWKKSVNEGLQTISLNTNEKGLYFLRSGQYSERLIVR